MATRAASALVEGGIVGTGKAKSNPYRSGDAMQVSGLEYLRIPGLTWLLNGIAFKWGRQGIYQKRGEDTNIPFMHEWVGVGPIAQPPPTSGGTRLEFSIE